MFSGMKDTVLSSVEARARPHAARRFRALESGVAY
jgi:hypothetical protein